MDGTLKDDDFALPPLRADLRLVMGPEGQGGQRLWKIHDPLAQRYFEIGQDAVDLLAAWNGATGGTLCERLAQRGDGFGDHRQTVAALLQFLEANELLAPRPQQTFARVRAGAQVKPSWFHRVLHGYLFFRVPLARPDRFLRQTLPYLAWAFRPGFWFTVLAMGLLGLYLLSRQWEAFLNTFTGMLDLAGVATYGACLVAVKALHELGHGYMAVRLGSRVTTMGVAFMVMVPVAYTDTTDAWRLRDRTDRVRIDVAGMAVEILVAVVATLAWVFLPDGALRSAAFALATTGWAMSLLVIPGGHLTDVFSYTATDADGSSATTTATFHIVAIPAVIGTTGTVIDEASLPAGSAPAGGPALVDGQFGIVINPLYPLAELAFGTTHFTLAELLSFHDGNPSPGIAMGHGILTLTGYDQGVADENGIVFGTVTFTYQLISPADNDALPLKDTIAITLKDALGNSTFDYPKPLSIQIIDDSPQAVADTADITEGGAPISGEALANDRLGADGAVAGGPVTGVAAGGTPASSGVGSGVAGSYGTLLMDASGHYSYTLNAGNASVQALQAGQTLTELFSYQIEDADGDVATSTLVVTVHGSNNTPQNTLSAQFNVSEDTALVLGGLSIADPDAGSDTITVTLHVDSGSLTGDAGAGVAVSGSGTDTLLLEGTRDDINAWLLGAPPRFVQVPDFHGSVALTMSTDDGHSGVDTDSSTIVIAGVADIDNDVLSTPEDQALSFNLLANDSFENTGAIVTAVTSPPASQGAIAFTPDGTVVFTPAANFHGTTSFSYTVSSGGVEETASISITVTTVNDVPVLSDPGAPGQSFDPSTGTYTATIDEDASFTGQLAATDADGDALSYVVATGPAHGTVTVDPVTGEYTYTPTDDYSGPDSFTVTISDGHGGFVQATVKVGMTPVVDIAGDSISTNEDTPVTFNVLANDSFENSGAIVTAVTQPPVSEGSITFAAAGTITFTPAPDFHGSTSFSYTVTSGGVSETATITVNVASVNDEPVLTDPGAPGQSVDPLAGR